MRFLTVFSRAVALITVAGCSGPEGNPDTGTDVSQASPPKEAAPSTGESSTVAIAANRDFSHLPAPYNEASYSLGRRTFKNCGTCHTLKEGGKNLVGPNLYGVIGREAGSLENFRYSPALEAASFTWTPELVEEWLSSPRTFLPGNNMTFAGIHKPDDRHAVIAYIMLETGYASPGDKAAAEEGVDP